MKSWLRWMLIITEVGGGFTGIVTILDYLYNSKDTPPHVLVFSLGFIALYGFVTMAGVHFAQDERKTSLLRAALWLQVPWISCPIIAWRFIAGLSIAVTLLDGEFGVVYWLGSYFQFDLFGNLPLGIGINLFPLLMLFCLGRVRDPLTGTIPSVAAQLDNILQLRLLNTPLADRGIRLQSLPEGGVSVGVRGNQYTSVDEVPDEEIRRVIRSAIAEWESRGPAQGSLPNGAGSVLEKHPGT